MLQPRSGAVFYIKGQRGVCPPTCPFCDESIIVERLGRETAT